MSAVVFALALVARTSDAAPTDETGSPDETGTPDATDAPDDTEPTDATPAPVVTTTPPIVTPNPPVLIPTASPDEMNPYESWFGANRYPAHVGRAIGEIVGLMAIGFAYYWTDPLANKEDFDNPTIKDRASFRALRFDTNLNTTNHVLHPTAGALVYTASRVNGLSIPAAFGLGVAQSFIWEMALEFHEKASINDLVYTAGGGVPFGEAFYKLGEYLNSSPHPGIGNELAAWTFGFPRRIHRAFDGDEMTPVVLPPDSLGFSSAFGHGFRIHYAPSFLSNDEGDTGTMHSMLIDAEIAAMPNFLARKSFSQTFFNGNFTETHFRLGWAHSENVESDLQIRATLLGQYAQKFDEDSGDGHAVMLGLGPALRFNHSSWLGRTDQLSTMHVFGPHADVWLRSGALLARIGAEAYLDFASLESLAFPDLWKVVGPDNFKTVLRIRGYQYSVGTWTRLRTEVGFGPLLAGGSVGYGTYGSIDGADRFQEHVARDIHGTDSVVETELHGGLQLGIVRVGGGFRSRFRTSTLDGVGVQRMDRDAFLDFGLQF